MLSIRVENKIIRAILKIRSYVRSFLLFGSFRRVRFGMHVNLSGKISLGKNISIKDFSSIRGDNVHIGNDVYIHENVFIRSREHIMIGSGTTINRNCCILDKVKIGSMCSIAPGVIIVGSNHNFTDTHIPIKHQGSNSKGIIIEDDVWIAANATILDGITIGKGSIIAAGAVVHRSVPPYSVMAGVPARLIKQREA